MGVPYLSSPEQPQRNNQPISTSHQTSISTEDMTSEQHSPILNETPVSSITLSPQEQRDRNFLTTELLLPPTISDIANAQHQISSLTTTDALLSNANMVEKKRKMRILVLSSDTGGGHRASAQALRAALEKLYPTDLHIDVVDFWVQLAEGPFCNFPQQYTFLAKHPWMWKLTYEATRFPPGRVVTEAFFNTFGHAKVRESFIKYAPDLIVSVHPLVNTLSHKVLDSLSEITGLPKVPYVTVVTDLGGAHPTWFHKQVDVTYIPSDGVHRVAKRVGIPNDRLKYYGLPVRSDFWTPSPPKADIREQLGIRTTGIAVLCVGGGDGVGGLKAIVHQLCSTLSKEIGTNNVQIIVVCGKNEKLRKYLEEKEWSIPLTALGFVSNMSDWMSATDIICTKAGPGTIAESLIRGLPIVITGFLPGQEEQNVQYVIDEQVGEFAKNPKEIAQKVVKWISEPGLLEQMSIRAKTCGKPNASLQIAEDIIQVAKQRIAENILTMEQHRTKRLQENRVGFPLLPRSQSLDEGISHSHLAYRLKFLLRIVMGSVLVRDALNHSSSSDRFPTSSTHSDDDSTTV